MVKHDFTLNGPFIELATLIKLLNLAPSGGAAKQLVAEGLVSVDGAQELRKMRKLYSGSVVRLEVEGEDHQISVR